MFFVLFLKRESVPGEEAFCPEAERAALAAEERSPPRRNRLADVKSWDEGESDFCLSPAGFLSDWTAVVAMAFFTPTETEIETNKKKGAPSAFVRASLFTLLNVH